MVWFGSIVFVVVALSQFIGYLVNINIPESTTIELNSLIHFTHVRNHGGVFGLLQGKGWLFAIISGLLLGAVVVYLCIGKGIQPHEYICFGFIVGGGLSNVLDRLIYGSVIDFIDIQHIPYWNYVFNTADVMVHIGIWPMLLISLFFISDKEKNIKIISMVQERMKKLSEYPYLTEYFFKQPDIDSNLLNKFAKDKTSKILENYLELYRNVKEVNWHEKYLDSISHELLESGGYKPKEAFMTIRIAISGRGATPPLFDVLEVLGKEETLSRLENCL